MSDLLLRYLANVWRGVVCIGALIWLPAVHAIAAAELTPKQKEYVANHPAIKVASPHALPPYSFYEKQQALGYSNDLIQLVAEKVGLSVEYTNQSTSDKKQLLAQLKAEQLDAVIDIAIQADDELIYSHYHPVHRVDALMTRSGDIFSHDFQELRNLAVIKGSIYEDLIKSNKGVIEVHTFDNSEAALNALMVGKVDALIEAYATLNFFKQSAQLNDLTLTPLVDSQFIHSTPQFIALHKDKQQLRDILDKGLLAVSAHELHTLQQKWLLLDALKRSAAVSLFTPREQQYLDNHGPLKMCVDPDWLPIEAIENGQYVGIGAEMVALFAQRLENPIQLVESKNWSESLYLMQVKQCDFIPLISKTVKREQFLSFTSPYLSFPLVLATYQDNPAYKLQQVLHRPLGTFAGSSYKAIFDDLYPTGDLREFASIEQGLEAVKRGDIYGYIDTLPVLAKQIQTAYPEVKLVDKLGYQYQLSLAVAKDDPILLDIFNKLIGTVEVKQREQILNHWLPTVYENELSINKYRMMILFALVALVIAIVLLFLFLRSRRSYQRLHKKSIKLEQIALCDYLTGLPNQHYFKDYLRKEWVRGCRSGEKISLMLIDIDHFKYFNQLHGRKEGDKCLIDLARRLQNIVKRPADVLARYQAEEFVILLPETDEQGLKALSAEIYYMMNGWRLNNKSSASGNDLTVSIGAACMIPSNDCPEVELYRRAERALYRAQDKGYNQMSIYY